jgi:drug/metabolite transporter (DMT)-like permease
MTLQQSGHKAFTAWALLILLSLIWGSSFILMKKGLVSFTPGQVAGIRILSAALFLLPVAIRNLPEISKKHIIPLTASGILGSLLPAFLFATAQTRINSSISGVLNGLTPIFTIIAGALFFRSKLTWRSFAGVIIGFIGMVILITAGSKGVFWNVNSYAFLIVLATMFYGININIINSRLRDLKSAHIISFSLMIIGPFALIYLLIDSGIPQILHNDSNATLSLLALVTLGVFGTAVAYMLFNKMLKITDPVFSSSVTYLIPVVAILWGLLDGEKLFLKHYLGIIIIIIGVFIANRSKKL